MTCARHACRGIIIIDDVSPLREIDQEYWARSSIFFESKPFVMKESSGGFGSSSGYQTEWYGGNPSTSAQIKYILPKRHTFGKMSMEIQDMDGNKVTTIGPGKDKGINTVSWNYTMKNPKVAKGRLSASAGSQLRRCRQVAIRRSSPKAEKDRFEHEFTVENDPKIGLTEEQYELKHSTTMKVYDMTEELAYLVYRLDAYCEEWEVHRSGF